MKTGCVGEEVRSRLRRRRCLRRWTAAIEGQLALFVGGEDADVERARPWLEAISKSMAHLGPVGKGQEAKLLNNLISIANYGMSAAIVDVATALGFERDQFIEILMAGSAQSFALKVAPGFVRKRSGSGAPGSFMGLHDLLEKDVDHCRKLPPSDPIAMQALLASCEGDACPYQAGSWGSRAGATESRDPNSLACFTHE